MADECCLLVGDLDLGIGACIISVSTNCSTEISNACGEDIQEGPSISTVNISGYASNNIWGDCASRAGVSIPYIRKYDCENDILYFIASGEGQSFYTGSADRYVALRNSLEARCTALNASAGSGPTSLYTRSTQVNGYGLTYNGDPFGFSTQPEGTTISLGGVLGGTYYLQNFSFDAQPGQLPVASYSLARAL